MILNVQYKTNSSTELIQSNEVIKLAINIDGTITDKNKLTVPGLDSGKDYKDLDLENIEMIQAQDSEAQEYLKTYPNIQTIIDSADIKDNNNNDNTVGGLYTYQEDTNIDNEKHTINYSLYLYPDGTFKYERSCFAPTGELGKYTIDGNDLILNVQYKTNSDTAINSSKDVIKLKINDDGSITDNNKLTVPGLDSNKDLKNIKMMKASKSENEEYLETYPSIQKVIDSVNVEDKKANDNIEGLYTYQGNTKIDTENYEFSYSLCLYADGTFKYERSCFAPVGELGKYTIEDNNLILKVDYETSSDTLTDPTIDVIKLKINDDGTITDKNKLTVPGLDSDKDLENIKMIKASESETKEYLKAYPNIQTIIDSSDIDYDNP